MNLFDREKRQRNHREIGPGDYLMIVRENNQVEIHQVISYDAEKVETIDAVFPRSDAVEYVRPEGGVLFCYRVDLEYQQECEAIKKLKENTVLSAVFGDYTSPEKAKNWLGIVAIVILGLVAMIR